MWFNKLFRRPPSEPQQAASEATVDQGIYYVYMIIGLQLVFVLTLVGIIMFVGKVLATPLWVFLAIFFLAVGGCIYLYRKAKRNLRRLRESLQKLDLSDRNYEISVMGGLLTMRVEQNSQRLLEAPERPHGSAVLDADTIETRVAR